MICSNSVSRLKAVLYYSSAHFNMLKNKYREASNVLYSYVKVKKMHPLFQYDDCGYTE